MINISSLNSIYYNWWKNIDKTIFLLIIFLFSLGLFFSLVSTSLIASDKLDTNNYFFFFNFLLVGRKKYIINFISFYYISNISICLIRGGTWPKVSFWNTN